MRPGVGRNGIGSGVADSFAGQGAAPAAFPSGDLPGPVPVPQWRPAAIFRRRAEGRPALHREAK